MRKMVSKRRWLARYRMGKFVPYIALMQYPDLKKRLKAGTYLANRDGVQRG